MIVNTSPKNESTEPEDRFLKSILGIYRGGFDEMNKKKKKKDKKEKEKEKEKKEPKMFNILDAEPDFKNCNGWSTAVDQKDLRLLRGSNVGVFMVNLTKGSMMMPHWNPSANEIAIVVKGEGIVRVVCSSRTKGSGCKNKRFRVKEGDVFAVPRFHPLAQMSFNNGSLVFMGFSVATTKNYPRFLAGKSSVIQDLDKEVLGLSLNVTNTTIERILSHEEDSIIVDCTSCAEEEVSIMQKEKEEEEESGKEKEEEEEESGEEEKEESGRREGRIEKEKKEQETREREIEKEKEEEPEIEERERRSREEAATWEQETARRQQKERQRRAREEEEEAVPEEEEEPEPTIKPYVKGFGYKDRKF